eukprot:CAMPEP_0180154618 /NCGR_PEP_ID=MMETSP0986-20121125/24284_1 /TAXON_ID=697907 /ORGANISM="non described non described, Strain CCMP2293" /LENGTH=191 /DNA_ID=CAMNT_0022103043 /DNA_START=206 /DNA_END=778 /DNA_ORIENTATION=-
MSGDALEGLGEEPLCEVVGLDAEAGVVAQEGEQLRVQRARGRHRVDPLRHHPQAGVAGAEEVARLARRLLQGARVLDACVGEARLQVSQLAEKGSVVVQLLLERGPATLLARARILPVRASPSRASNSSSRDAKISSSSTMLSRAARASSSLISRPNRSILKEEGGPPVRSSSRSCFSLSTSWAKIALETL